MSKFHYFIGIEVPEELREQFQSVQQALELSNYYRRVTHAQDLHCTLSFIGDLEEEELQGLTEQLQLIKSPSFQLTTDSIAGFGEGKAPRVVYARVAPAQQLIHLEEQVWSVTADFQADRKTPFIPHITLAKRAKPLEPIKFTGKLAVSWKIEAFHLYRVHKGKSPSYEKLTTFSLSQDGTQ
ncbi:RNA 2',3'-cyclic phosphodiesterase [Chryseomicrobium sp. FSL W7-1435]|uniref:RNA 2',3'-cyclic phosphodiesterase n=1 Tax=Chryseomicrobium sp. FSL W7-1435 TaxID=2921704 RepID=UPI00315AFF02